MRNLSIALDLKESVSLLNEDGMTTSSIEVILMPKTDTDTILPTGDVLAAKRWEIFMMDPSETIEEGDVLLRTSGLKLNITRVNRVKGDNIGDIQWLEAEELL